MTTLTLTKVATWLPGFDGYYGSVWEDCEEDMELENINYIRKEKGLAPITYDDCEWDYKAFYDTLSKEIALSVSDYLSEHGFISGFDFEKLSSPKEYNFANDSIHVTFHLSEGNKNKIGRYLEENKEAFSEYLKDKYTSYSGFFSSYSNDVNQWLVDDYFTHSHKLGAVLNFILRHQLKTEDNMDNVDMWLLDRVENRFINVSNYSELIGEK